MVVIGTGGLHEWGGGLSSQLSVQFFFSEHSFSQIYSISEVIHVNQSQIKSGMEGCFLSFLKFAFLHNLALLLT